MVGGGDPIAAVDERWMERFLKDYRDRAYVSRVLQKRDVKLALVKKCLGALLSYERDLLVFLLVQGASERVVAKKTGLTRYRVREEKKRLLRLTARAMQEATKPKKPHAYLKEGEARLKRE